VDIYAETDADQIVWTDPDVGELRMLVVGFRDYRNTPRRMRLKHYQYAMIEQEQTPGATK
jgi:hypothetical protein